MTPEQATLAERVRTLLASEQTMREKSMFGVRSFKVNEKMVVGARKDGGLLVRVDARRHDELLGRPGAKQAEMGPGRTMGPGLEAGKPGEYLTDRLTDETIRLIEEHRKAKPDQPFFAYLSHYCQTAFKRDPRSASKRDPLFGYDAGLLKMALRCVRRRAGVARPEARAAQDRFLKAPKVAVSCGF